MGHSQLEHDHELLVLDNIRARLYHTIVGPVLRASGVEDQLIREGRDGGYYALYCCTARRLQVILSLGSIGPAVAARACETCQEKCLRLAAHPDHQTSRQSAEPDLGKYGGAVRGTAYLHSFSGLTEELNEVVAVLIAITFGDLTLTQGSQFLGDTAPRYLPIVDKAFQGVAA